MRTTRWVVPAVVLCATSAAQATVTLTFSGTFDVFGGVVFGVPEPTPAFSMQITFDPALDTNTVYIPIGGTFSGYPASHEWYGYSASSIVFSNVTFGTKTWTPAALQSQFLTPELGADMFFDADIGLSVPTRSLIRFVDSHGTLELGHGTNVPPPSYYLLPICMIDDNGSDPGDEFGGFGRTELTTMTITSTVPEPAATALAALAAAGVLSARRRTSDRVSV